MGPHTDILKHAIADRLKRYGRDMWFHACLGVLSVVVGVGAFLFLWSQFDGDSGPFVREMAGGATSLVTFGVGSIFAGKLLTLRDEIKEGREWLALYGRALGPPPDGVLGDVKAKILSWLEGP
ncbi:MAG: hypothetical protein AAGA70_06130 [Pseudomonadota bacterium]